MIDSRLESMRWRALHRGVYQLSPALPPGATELAAVLACGASSFARHYTAAGLHRLPLPVSGTDLHVTIVGRSARRRAGIIVHRVSRLGPDGHHLLDGIPVTTPARTIIDLGLELESGPLEELVAEAQRRNSSTVEQVRRLIARYPGRRGVGRLKALLESGDSARVRSEAERRFLALLRRARLRRPEMNVVAGSYEVDFLWRNHRVVVELDGHAWHAARPARERDARRDQDLIVRGHSVIRATAHQIECEPEALLARVAGALGHAAATSSANQGYPVASS